jgi:hypothetical protein
MDLVQYVNKMATRGAWGGGVDLLAAHQTFRVNIHIYSKHSSKYYTRIATYATPAYKRTIHLEFANSSHYNVLCDAVS